MDVYLPDAVPRKLIRPQKPTHQIGLFRKLVGTVPIFALRDTRTVPTCATSVFDVVSSKARRVPWSLVQRMAKSAAFQLPLAQRYRPVHELFAQAYQRKFHRIIPGFFLMQRYHCYYESSKPLTDIRLTHPSRITRRMHDTKHEPPRN